MRNLNDNGSATRPSSSSSFVAKSTSDGGFDRFDTAHLSPMKTKSDYNS